MRIATAIICLLFTFFTPLTHADQLLIEPDMGRAPIINAMNNSKQSLKLVMYNFTDKPLLSAFLKQKKQGKRISVILEKKPYMTIDINKKTMSALNRQQVDWRGTAPGFRLTHQKTLLIDDKQAIIMTFNFTHSAFDKQRNFALIIDKPDEVNEIREHFQADWQHQAVVDASPNLLWSPNSSRKKIMDLIHQAKNEIDIYAQSISDHKIAAALIAAAKRGVKINILTSAKSPNKLLDYLQHVGIQIHHSQHYYIHAKVFIFDHQKALVGSINLTRASLDHNRELSVITEDAKIVKQLEDQFWRDYN